jgi:hypothetical protein
LPYLLGSEVLDQGAKTAVGTAAAFGEYLAIPHARGVADHASIGETPGERVFGSEPGTVGKR